MSKFFHTLFSILIDAIFPQYCIGCGTLDTLLCERCYETLEFLQFPVQLKSVSQLKSITCCCRYAGLAKKIMVECKYREVKAVATLIAHIVYYSVQIPTCDFITFVPMHNKKQRVRGFNQSELIAQELSKLLNIPILPLLKKNTYTQSQMSISNKNQREKNIAGTIQSIDHNVQQCQNAKILIVDDVYTSGATLEACVSALQNSGIHEIHGLCFAHRL